MQNWALQDAKNKLSLVVDKAIADGVQTITRHGKPAAVVLSVSDYKKLIPQNRINKLLNSMRGVKLEITRERSPGRKVDL
jgi:antitoxin Phd